MRIPVIDKTQWHPWFAWYPLRIGDSLVWLEAVRRRKKQVWDDHDICYVEFYEYDLI